MLEEHSKDLPLEVETIVSDQLRLGTLRTHLPKNDANDGDFDNLTALAADLFDAPITLLSLVDEKEQWFQSCIGLSEKGTPIEQSFCAHAISQEEPVFVVLDATTDDRFSHNPLVTGPPNIRFYAGSALEVADQRIGTLCVIDDKPRSMPDEKQLLQLQRLAQLASSLIETKHYTRDHLNISRALSMEKKRVELAVAAGGIATWIWDVETDEVICDDILFQLFDVEPTNEPTAELIVNSIHEEDRGRVGDALAATIEHGETYETEFRVANGKRWLQGRGAVLETGDDGAAKKIVGVNIDITHTKQSEENKRLLLREVNHRVKNTLAILQSMAVQTLRKSKNTEEFTRAFSGRLQSIGAAHTLLSDTEWKPVDVHKLIVSQLAPIRSEMHRIELDGESFSCTPDTALGIGLIIHELATNALKYGAMSVPDGRVRIDFVVEPSDDGRKLFKLYWQELDGPPVSEPQETGFGSILIERSLDKVLGSKVEVSYNPSGVRALLSVPVD